MKDTIKHNYELSEQNITNISNKLINLIDEVKEIAKIINTSEQDWQGITKEAFVGKLQDTQKELIDFFNDTFNPYIEGENRRNEENQNKSTDLKDTANTLDQQ